MTSSYGFKQIKKQNIPELKTEAELFRHIKTGAELLSLKNDDENKVFGIAFRTPPSDSTGVAHILEHSVLCGSRKYPAKEPFVELLKGSLQTFLNAMTYPDKTCYPVASQNLKDFYNLVDVYLDAVFYPRLNPFIFKQEGWHYELENPDSPLIYKGVVFNEMKGAYSSPDNLLSTYSQQSLFPDTIYGLDSGGDPGEIPGLTFDQFKAFHEKYYHPSNARIFFYGDDNPEERLILLDNYLRDFDPIEIDSSIPVQTPLKEPKDIIRSFAAGGEEGEVPKGMMTVNWLFHGEIDLELIFALHMLEFILLGMPGSPLRKALIDSGYGEDLAGGGLESELRQMYFSTGLKGIDISLSDKIETLIIETLKKLSNDGIDNHTIEAALNSIEFVLRENNAGNYPRGLLLMLRSLTTWLYDGDPLGLIAFETPMRNLKSIIASDKRFFESLIDRFFINNPHRTTLLLKPDLEMEEIEKAAEKDKLIEARSNMNNKKVQDIIETTQKLKQMQEAPDPPEALASIPTLKLEDLEKKNSLIPSTESMKKDTEILFHDLFTNGILYFDIGFDLHALPQNLLPYVRLFGRALLEMGTDKEDYVTLTQRISRKTGGIHSALFSSVVKDSENSAAWLFLRGKSMTSQAKELLDIIKDVLQGVRMDNRERFRQMVLESKARKEHSIIPGGHQLVNLRLRSHFSEADWMAEQTRGLSYLFFLRDLARRVDDDWKGVLSDLETIRQTLINRQGMLFNFTFDEAGFNHLQPMAYNLLDAIPSSTFHPITWDRNRFSDDAPDNSLDDEGLIIPSQINYVGKAFNIYESGYSFHGSAHVICRYIRNAWLWDRIRVQGGAYGAFCLFDRLSGVLSFVSYRDPNLEKTLDAFDNAGQFLEDSDLNDEECIKNIIGAIGDIDQYRLPDAKGYISMVRKLSGESDEDRQKVRDDVLSTSVLDFRSFSSPLEDIREKGMVKILGSESAIQEATKERPGWLNILKVL